jgi:hypothetical protein
MDHAATLRAKQKRKMILMGFELVTPPKSLSSMEESGRTIPVSNQLTYVRASTASAKFYPVLEILMLQKGK